MKNLRYLYKLDEDIFRKIKATSRNINGRALAWDFYRINYEDLTDRFGLDDPRLGQALTDISNNFENQFMFDQVLLFLL